MPDAPAFAAVVRRVGGGSAKEGRKEGQAGQEAAGAERTQEGEGFALGWQVGGR